MKIFNVENGIKSVYVQNNDLAYIMHNCNSIPAELIHEVFSNIFIVNDDNRWEFQKFTSPTTVSFFEKIEWIPDYKRYRDMTESEILSCEQVLVDEKNRVAREYNEMPMDDEKRLELEDKYELLDFHIHSLAEILWVKQGHKVMPFPIVPDSDGFTLSSDNKNCLYEVKQGVNPLQYLLYRVDGKPFNEKIDTNIPQGLINSADGLCITSNTEHNEFFGNFELSRKLTDDKQFLVTTFKIIVPEEEKNKEKEKRTLGKRVLDKLNKLFGRRTD